LPSQNDSEAPSSEQSEVRFFDIKCIRAFWDEKKSFILILDDSSNRLRMLRRFTNKLATEVIDLLNAPLESL
jgi:hypothetical protein